MDSHNPFPLPKKKLDLQFILIFIADNVTTSKENAVKNA